MTMNTLENTKPVQAAPATPAHNVPATPAKK